MSGISTDTQAFVPQSLLSRVGIACVCFILPLACILTLGSLMQQQMQRQPSMAKPVLHNLHTWFAGEEIDLPRQSGIWLLTHARAKILLNLGQAVGQSETIKLCQQRSLAKDDPARLVPLYIGSWQALSALTVRQALLLPPEWQQHAPQIRISGRLAANLQSLHFTLPAHARLLTDHQQYAWILWHANKAQGKAQSFRYAIQIRSSPTICPASGGLPAQAGMVWQISLFQAENSSRPDKYQTSYPALIMPHAGESQIQQLPLGRYQIPLQAPGKQEDQALFEASLARGLIRLHPNRREIALAPADLAAALQLRQIPPAWKHLPQATGNVADDYLHLHQLLQSLHYKPVGWAVRQQIKQFNLAQSLPVAQRRALNIQWSPGRGLYWQPGTQHQHALLVGQNPQQLSRYRQALHLQSSDGQSLLRAGQLSPLAQQVGLGNWLSHWLQDGQFMPVLSAAHTSTVAKGDTEITMRLSIDSRWQMAAQSVLQCQAIQEGRWQNRQCQPAAPSMQPSARQADLIVLDAENGDILAALSIGADLQASPWRHDGRAHAAPGSSFKLMGGLALEQVAQQRAILQAAQMKAQLAGLNHASLVQVGQALGFSPHHACYPGACGQQSPQIPNYKRQIPAQHQPNQSFGLQQALTYSTNTWFAWQLEQIDASAAQHYDARDFAAGGLQHARPWLTIARQVGWSQAFNLDGGLFPHAVGAWPNLLRTSASQVDALPDRHQLRLQALGQRMQTTPLHMAMLAAAIAQGRAPIPRLILQSEKHNASVRHLPDLTMPLQRIRAGMRGVVQEGTASSAFAGNHPTQRAIREGVFGKTGSAETPDHNSAWFVGYVAPHTLPNESRTLAFAVRITHTKQTGGSIAAPVIAALLREMAE